ncbi:MAG: efflux RND transporter periplasmic adaptor subunit, partial [Pseudomonadota bacterium]
SSTVRIDALGADALSATLAARVPQSDPGARTFLVRLKLTEPPPSITPGMSATASLAIASTDATLLVPRDALIRYPDGTTTVFVVEDGESTQARQRTVEVTRVDGETAVIASGLNPGEPVVIRGNEVLSDGQSVRVINGGQ